MMFGVFDRRQLGHAPAREIHNGDWTDHAETPARAQSIVAKLPDLAAARDFGLGPIERVHAPEYIAFLRDAHRLWLEAGRTGDALPYVWPVVARRSVHLTRVDALLGRFSFDAATPIGTRTWEAAYWGAQTALTALAPLLDGTETRSFALCRPPGHHAGADYFGGYCYLNNAAIATQAARDTGRSRVAILDLDYHHGNGTQDIFWSDPAVLFVSIHADPATDYPFFWGHGDECGEGDGKGATLDLPLPRGTTLSDYLIALATSSERIRQFDPSLIVISFGADTFSGDPISGFALATADYPVIASHIAKLSLPTLIVMEGGYATAELGANVAAFLSGFSA